MVEDTEDWTWDYETSFKYGGYFSVQKLPNGFLRVYSVVQESEARASSFKAYFVDTEFHDEVQYRLFRIAARKRIEEGSLIHSGSLYECYDACRKHMGEQC